MPLRLSNRPEIHLAQEWIAQLHVWIARNGLTGYDPFDIRVHPLLRAIQTKPRLRKMSTLTCDLFPRLSRWALRIPPTLNPEALALVGMGHLRLYQISGDQSHLDNGLDCLRQLESCAVAGGAGLCWGYPFDLRERGFNTPANTPVAVVSAIAGQAFLLAHEITGEAAHLDAAQRIAGFFLQELPRVAWNKDDAGGWCFAYAMTDRRRIHNANLLALEHVMRAAARSGNTHWPEQVAPALQFAIALQHANGAWHYGEHAPGEACEAKLLRVIDHHHTGAVLRALRGIYEVAPTEDVKEAIQKGVGFYRKLIRPDGCPVKGHAPWPVDIRACAEGILCPVTLGDMMPGGRTASLLVMRWAHRRLRDKTTGAPWNRRYPFAVTRVIYPRWAVAWMYRALADYLYHRRDEI